MFAGGWACSVVAARTLLLGHGDVHHIAFLLPVSIQHVELLVRVVGRDSIFDSTSALPVSRSATLLQMHST